jgi:hypothetical protein
VAWNPTYVQTDTNILSSPTIDSRTKTFAGDVTVGNLLFAVGWESNDLSALTCTDSLGSTWAKLSELPGVGLSLWYAVAIGSGPCSVTMTWDPFHVTILLDLFEFTPDGASSLVLDGENATDGPGTSHPAGSVTPTDVDTLAWYICGVAGGHDENGSPSGYTKRKGLDSFGGSGTMGLHIYTKLLTTTGAENPAMTTASSETTDRLLAVVRSGVAEVSIRHLLFGTGHTVTGDDAFLTGVGNTANADNVQVHGENGTNNGDRSALFNMDGVTRTVSDDDTVHIYGTLKVNGTTVASGGASPTTTKGDMIVRSASADDRLPVGANGEVLTADSAETLGVKWSAAGVSALVKIAEQTPSGVAFVTFSSLGSYTHLEILWSARGTEAATSTNMNLTFNGDTGANYDRQLLSGNATTVAAAEALAATSAAIGSVTAASATADMAGTGVLRIFDYRGTTFQKGGVSNENLRRATTSGNTFTRQFSIGWRNTAAITSVTITLAAGNFVAGSKFSLYGIT